MDYFPWCNDEADDSLAWITDEPEELGSNGWRLSKGVSCKDWFPSEGMIFDLSKRHGLKLSDAPPNTQGFVFVSQKLKGLLEKLAPETQIEFLPIRLRNQKKKVLDKPYFIANVLDVVPCTDMKKSEFWMDTIIKTQVQRFSRLVLNERKIPKEKKLFRLGEQTDLILVRRDLGQPIVDADCTGMFFMNLDEYGEEFR